MNTEKKNGNKHISIKVKLLVGFVIIAFYIIFSVFYAIPRLIIASIDDNYTDKVLNAFYEEDYDTLLSMMYPAAVDKNSIVKAMHNVVEYCPLTEGYQYSYKSGQAKIKKNAGELCYIAELQYDLNCEGKEYIWCFEYKNSLKGSGYLTYYCVSQEDLTISQ